MSEPREMKTLKEITADIDLIIGRNGEVTDDTHMDLVDDIVDYIESLHASQPIQEGQTVYVPVEKWDDGWTHKILNHNIYLKQLTLPKLPTEEEIGAELLPYLIEFDPYLDWSELLDRLTKAILTLINK